MSQKTPRELAEQFTAVAFKEVENMYKGGVLPGNIIAKLRTAKKAYLEYVEIELKELLSTKKPTNAKKAETGTTGEGGSDPKPTKKAGRPKKQKGGKGNAEAESNGQPSND